MQSSNPFPVPERDLTPLLSNDSSSGHLDSTSSHDSLLHQKAGVLHQVKAALAARFGFFSHDSLKTVSTFISPVPTEVIALQQMRSTSLFRQSSGVDDRSLAFQNGIKYMSYNPESKWTKSLEEAAMGHVLLHNSQPSSPGSGELTISRVPSPSTTSRNFPAPEEVYRLLLKSAGNGSRTIHPYGVSSLVFAFASLISLSIHHPISSQSTINNQSPCFDLSSLYGFTPADADQIRLKDGTGMLAPDCFCEDRVTLLPPAVSAMLILWNRNHNFIARRLSISYGERFKKVSQDSKDEHIFQTARLINCANFRSIIATDFLKGLMGLSAADPNPNINVLSDEVKVQDLKTFFESTFCYNWSSSMSKDDASILEGTMTRMLGLENGELANIHTAQFQRSLKTKTSEIDKDRTRRSYPGLPRPLNGRFKDEDIAQVLQQATERSACAFGYRQVPLCAQELELQKIKEARGSNVCSLNEYRKSLGLKPHKSFIDWNPNIEIANHAEQLYKDIDNLELYVGLHAEDAVPCGFGLGYTLTYGLLTDLVSRLRSDPANAKITEHTVTLWGYQDCQNQFHNGAFGNFFPKILLRNLPRHYPHNNVYSLFPFCTPRSAIECLKQNPQLPDEIDCSEYDHDVPKRPIVHTLTTKDTISHVLNTPDTYHTPYGERLKRITDGYGYFLGFDDEVLHDRDQIMTLHALIPDSGQTLRQYAATMREMTENAIIAKRQPSGTEGYTIDIVKDVINPVCTRWVCQTLCDYELRCEKPDSGSGQVGDAERMDEEEMHEAFGALYTYVFRNSDPEQAWAVRRKAIRASKILRGHIRDKIPTPKWLHPSSHLMWPWLQTHINDVMQYVTRVCKEFSSEGVTLPAFTAQTFLKRVVQARQNISVGDLHPSLDEIRKRVKPINRWEDENDLKDQELEVSRIVANVLGLSVVTSVNFPLALIQAIDFYMNEKRTEERAEIIRLSNTEYRSAHDNIKLMGYIREAQRIDQPLGLWRDVAQDGYIPRESNGPEIHVHRGERIFIDFQKAHSNPADFPKPHKIDVNRSVPSIQGLGLHKCPALSFIDQTMPEIFKVVFQLPNVRRGPGGTGRLIKTKSTADPLDSDPVAFVSQAKELAFFPQNLILEYDADPKSPFGSDKKVMSTKEQAAWNKMTSPVTRHEVARERMDWTLRFIVIAGLLWKLFNLLLSIQAAFYGMWPTKKITVRPVTAADIKREDILCPDPIKLWHGWEAATMTAGPDGVPLPLEYISNNSTAHKLSVFDVDKRDMQMAIYVDDDLRGVTSDFDLDLEEDCGLDGPVCAQKRFSGGWLVIPPGKHEVRIEWNGKEYVNGTHEPDLGEDSSRRLLWQRADCGS